MQESVLNIIVNMQESVSLYGTLLQIENDNTISKEYVFIPFSLLVCFHSDHPLSRETARRCVPE